MTGPPYAAHSPLSTSACSSTSCAAFSCLSGGYPCFRKILFTSTRNCARTLSRTVQSIVTFRRIAAASSCAICRSTASPSTCTALSLTSSAS